MSLSVLRTGPGVCDVTGPSSAGAGSGSGKP
jgi:hypothetical protein